VRGARFERQADRDLLDGSVLLVKAPSAFARFPTWAALLDYLRDCDALERRIYYHAPMDVRPVQVCVSRVFKNGKVRIAKPAHDVDAFTADEGHLDRFRRPA
jgi:hypothetical protein